MFSAMNDLKYLSKHLKPHTVYNYSKRLALSTRLWNSHTSLREDLVGQEQGTRGALLSQYIPASTVQSCFAQNHKFAGMFYPSTSLCQVE